MPALKANITELKSRLGRSGVGAKLARGSIEAFLMRILGTLLSFFMAMLLSRAMGVGEYGVYIFAVSWLQLLVLPAKMGMDSVLVRFVSAYREVENWPSFLGLLRRSLHLTLLSSSIIIVCFLGAIYLLLWHTNNALATTMAFGAIVLVIEPIIGLRQASLRAMGYIALANFVLTVFRPLFIIAIAGLTLLLKPELIDSFSMIGVYAAASLVGLVVVELLSRRRLPSQVLDTRTAAYHDREWLSMAFPMLFSTAVLIILNRSDVLMLGMLTDTSQVGFYHVGIRIAGFVSIGLTSVNAIAGPLFAGSYAGENQHDLQKIARLSAWGIFSVCAPVSLVILLFGKSILSIFGAEFVAAYAALCIMVVGQLVNAMTGSVGLMMTMTGYHKESLYVNVFAALCNITLNWVLIPRFGIEGAATATAATIITANLIRFVFVGKRLGVNTTIFHSLRRTA